MSLRAEQLRDVNIAKQFVVVGTRRGGFGPRFKRRVASRDRGQPHHVTGSSCHFCHGQPPAEAFSSHRELSLRKPVQSTAEDVLFRGDPAEEV